MANFCKFGALCPNIFHHSSYYQERKRDIIIKKRNKKKKQEIDKWDKTFQSKATNNDNYY